MLITDSRHRFEVRHRSGESDLAYGKRLGEAVAWCVERFGRPGHPHWDDNRSVNMIVGGYFTFAGAIFMFSNDDEAMEFKLRWM